MYSRIVASFRSAVEMQYRRAQKRWPAKACRRPRVGARDVDGALPLDEAEDLRDGVLWWNGEELVHVVHLEGTNYREAHRRPAPKGSPS